MAVYFIRAGHSGPVKIGTADDPERRLRHLQTAHYETLRIIRTLDGGVDVESWLHKRYKKHRIRGEWFDYQESMESIEPPEIQPKPPVVVDARPATFLTEYLHDNEITIAEFASSLDVTPQAVRYWVRGIRFPARKVIAKIEEITNGQVAAAHFYERDAA